VGARTPILWAIDEHRSKTIALANMERLGIDCDRSDKPQVDLQSKAATRRLLVMALDEAAADAEVVNVNPHR
jgi:hypothetical protein